MLPRAYRFLHTWFHYTGILLMIAGLPFSVFLMSLSQFFLAGNWVLEGGYKEKIRQFFANKPALMLSGVFLLNALSYFWSENSNEALKMLRINLPLFLFPFLVSGRAPLSPKVFGIFLRLFILSVGLSVLVCASIGLPRWINGTFNDIREVSLFISHIRFSLLIDLAILLCLWVWIQPSQRMWNVERYVLPVVALLLLFFLLILQSLNGIFILGVVGLGWFLFSPSNLMSRNIKRVAALVLVMSMVILGYLLSIAWHQYFTPDPVYSRPLSLKTASGNAYHHQLDLIENGHYVHAFVCESELRAHWRLISKVNIDSLDQKGHPVYETLIRYLNSRGLPKDAAGISQLSSTDVRNIENGMANFRYAGWFGLRMRFYQLMYEVAFMRSGGKNASGHSVMMKLEFWKAAISLIIEKPIMGYGVGDVPDSFKQYYKDNNSWLQTKWWMTAHNQYLYWAVSSGLIGWGIFILCFFGPLSYAYVRKNLPFMLYFSIAALAMLTEDMLTTQAGVSFVAFFYSFFLFCKPQNEA
ncbi:MAG: O-antigen ligase family protein [Bacteroidia bacterium]